MCHLSKLVLRSEREDGNVLMNLPLINNFAVLKVHAIQLVRVVVLLQDQVAILVVQHDLLGGK